MPSRANVLRAQRAAAIGVAALLVSSCQTARPSEITLAEGIVFRDDEAAGVQTVTVDRDRARYRTMVVAENITRVRNNVVGDAYTPLEWARRYNALVAINGGFFGDTYDSVGRRKQLVQLCLSRGNVVAPGHALRATPPQKDSYLRSAIGFDTAGNPGIEWATADSRQGPRRFERPVNPRTGRPWQVASAVAAGPRLIHAGKRALSDREERLVHQEAASRMSVAFGERYIVFCRADNRTYPDLTDYLITFARETLHSPFTEAMCLDGGPSAQLVIRDGSGWRDTTPTGVHVPSALVLVPVGN